MGQVEVGDGFRHGEKTMDVVGAGKHCLPDLPRSYTVLLHQPNHLRLALLKRAEVSMEQFLVVAYRIAVSAVNQRRRTRTQTREADEIFGKRRETSGGIQRIGR